MRRERSVAGRASHVVCILRASRVPFACLARASCVPFTCISLSQAPPYERSQSILDVSAMALWSLSKEPQRYLWLKRGLEYFESKGEFGSEEACREACDWFIAHWRKQLSNAEQNARVDARDAEYANPAPPTVGVVSENCVGDVRWLETTTIAAGTEGPILQ